MNLRAALRLGLFIRPPNVLNPELELGLIQTHMAQRPVMRVGVGAVRCACVARAISAEKGGMGERGCARRLGGCAWM